MGKLNGLTTYLCGAIDHTEDSGRGWREKITPVLEKMGVIVYNPLQKPIVGYDEDEDFVSKRRSEQLLGNFDYVISQSYVRSVDLRMVDKSDFLIVHLDMTQKPFGTIEEIVTANRQKKPILVWTAQGKNNVSPWLIWMLKSAETIFNTEKELIQYLRRIDSGAVDGGKRWIFFESNPILDLVNSQELNHRHYTNQELDNLVELIRKS